MDVIKVLERQRLKCYSSDSKSDSDTNTKFVPKMLKTVENMCSNLVSVLSGTNTCLLMWYTDKGKE